MVYLSLISVFKGKLTWNGIKSNSSEGSDQEKDVLETFDKMALIYPETIKIDESQTKYR